MLLQANWSFPTGIRFGVGRIAELAETCQIAGIKRPLLVTDEGMRTLPITRDALERLLGAGAGSGALL